MEVLEVVQLSDLDIEVLFYQVNDFFFTLISFAYQRETKPIRAKTPHATHTMTEVRIVRVLVITLHHYWYIIVDYQIYLWEIETSRQHICRDQALKILLSEIVDDLVSVFVVHTTNEDV